MLKLRPHLLGQVCCNLLEKKRKRYYLLIYLYSKKFSANILSFIRNSILYPCFVSYYPPDPGYSGTAAIVFAAARTLIEEKVCYA